MRIGILGTGNMAEALATRWTESGHEVLVAGRDGKKAAALAERIGGTARHGSLREAAGFGTAALLAVPYAAVEDALRQAGAAQGTLRGRTLIDCVNPMSTDPAEKGTPLPVAGGRPSAAAHIAAVAQGAHVVKAFNLCTPAVWRTAPPLFDGEPLAVPLCGDDPMALETVRTLIRDMGCVPLPAGGLDRAGLQESALAFLAGFWFQGLEPRAALPPIGAHGQ